MNEERAEATEAQRNEVTGSADSNSSSDEKQTSTEELLQAKDAEIKSHIDRIKRIQADFENYKKRIAREQEGLSRSIENRVYLKVLPIFDNFDRAVSSYKENADQNALAEGVMQIFAQFEDLLAAEEIVPIDAMGRSFDPMLHEALLSVESDQPPNTVLEEFERGFKRGKEVLRPSRVKVSRKITEPKSTVEHEGSESNEIDNENGKGES